MSYFIAVTHDRASDSMGGAIETVRYAPGGQPHWPRGIGGCDQALAMASGKYILWLYLNATEPLCLRPS